MSSQRDEGMTEPKGTPGEDGGPTIARCPIHGIAYDVEREECPECAKGDGKEGTDQPFGRGPG